MGYILGIAQINRKIKYKDKTYTVLNVICENWVIGDPCYEGSLAMVWWPVNYIGWSPPQYPDWPKVNYSSKIYY